MAWTGNVREALRVIFKENRGNAVTVCSEDGGDTIGNADSYEQALNLFAEFLDARVVYFYWPGGIDSSTACIVVNRDDIEKVRTVIDGQETFRFHRKPGSVQSLKHGCVAENAKCIDVQELKVLLDRKDDVVSALQQKILELETDIGDYIKIVNVLNPDEAERSINGLRLIATVLEEKCKSRNS